MALVRKGGSVNLFGGCPAGTKISLETNRLHYDQITVKSSFHHRPAAFRAALTALEQGLVPPGPFIGGEQTLEELPRSNHMRRWPAWDTRRAWAGGSPTR